MSTTTGTKIVNNYVEKGKDDVYYWFGSDLYGRDIWTRTWEAPASPLSSPWRLPSLIWSSV